MAKFTVHLQQYVEQVATLEIEAATPEEARDIAITSAPSATWTEGDDAEKASVFAVHDTAGNLVWERW
jgi:hypothetical protein